MKRLLSENVNSSNCFQEDYYRTNSTIDFHFSSSDFEVNLPLLFAVWESITSMHISTPFISIRDWYDIILTGQEFTQSRRWISLNEWFSYKESFL